MPRSLIAANRNTAPSRTPTVAIDVAFRRSTTQAIRNHASPDSRKTHQYRAPCRTIMRSPLSIGLPFVRFHFVRFRPSPPRRYVQTESESRPKITAPRTGTTAQPGPSTARRRGLVGATTLPPPSWCGSWTSSATSAPCSPVGLAPILGRRHLAGCEPRLRQHPPQVDDRLL